MKIKFFLLTLSFYLLALSSHGQTLQDAIKYTGNEEYEKANSVLKSLLSTQPSNGEFYFYMGENYFQWGRTDKDSGYIDSAQYMFQKGINLNATGPLNYVGLGMIQLIKGDIKPAEDNFYKAQVLSKFKDPNVLANIAQGYIISKNKDIDCYGKAIRFLNQAIALDKTNPLYHIYMGDALLGQNPTDGSKAVDEYNNALSIDPKNVLANLKLGILWRDAQQYQMSYDFFLKATQLDSTFAPAYRQLAEMYFDSRRYDEAIAAYKKYLKLNPALSAQIRYGEFLYLAGKYASSDSVLTNVTRQDTNDPYVYRFLGYSQLEVKDCKNGLVNINKFFYKIKGTKISVINQDYTTQGKLYECNHLDSLAIVTYNEAISMKTNSPSSTDVCDLYYRIAYLYYKDTNYTMAIQYFRTKIKLCPQTSGSFYDYFYMGISQFWNKQYPGADSSFQMLNTLNPTVIGYQWRTYADELIDSTYATGSAIPAINDYIAKAGNDTIKYQQGLINGYSYLATYYAKNKDKAKATYWCKKILASDPNNQRAKDILANLNPKVAPKKK